MFELIDNWSIAELENDGHLLIIRFRDKLNSLCGKEVYPHLLQVAWEFSDPSETGMPDRIEASKASEFEDFIVDSIESDLQSVLTFVATSDGFRSWYIYTNDVDEFSNRLHNIPQKKEKYPIEIHLTTNENWKSYDDVRIRCKER